MRVIRLLVVCVLVVSTNCARPSLPPSHDQDPTLFASSGVWSGAVAAVPGSGANGWSVWDHQNALFAPALLTNYINPHRQSIGLNPLDWHGGLAAVSKIQADDMVAQNYVATVTPQGISIYQRLGTGSNPSIPFVKAAAFVGKTPGNSLQIWNAMKTSSDVMSVVSDPSVQLYGGWYTNNPGGKGAMIFMVP